MHPKRCPPKNAVYDRDEATMIRAILAASVGIVMVLSSTARADESVLDACKGESKTVVTGQGRASIAVVYPDAFPVKTTPAMRNAVGARLARAEKAKIVPAKDVFAARELVEDRKWSATSTQCTVSASLIAILGLKHTNLHTATAEVICNGADCELRIDIERHGKPSKDRWGRYVAKLTGPKDQIKTYMTTAPKLKSVPSDKTSAGMAVTKLATGVVTTRSNVDGALEVDRAMEASAAFAACRPKARKADDIRGYRAEWVLSAIGRPGKVMVKPFAGTDPTDKDVAQCLRKALETTQLACPRDGKPADVVTSICL
jgi:hypothetical protein